MCVKIPCTPSLHMCDRNDEILRFFSFLHFFFIFFLSIFSFVYDQENDSGSVLAKMTIDNNDITSILLTQKTQILIYYAIDRLITVYMYIKYEFKIYHVVQREIDYAIFSLLTCIIYREISRLQLTIYLVIRKL